MSDDALRRELRRNRNTLIIIGTGVIAMSMWSVIKTILLNLLKTDSAVTQDVGSMDTISRVSVFLGVAIALGGDLLLRLFVGLSARREGLGGKKGNAYLIITLLMAFVYAIIPVFAVAFFSQVIATENPFDLAISLVIELTSMIMLVELVVAALRGRRLEKKLAERGDG